jgi:hypothetical protein
MFVRFCSLVFVLCAVLGFAASGHAQLFGDYDDDGDVDLNDYTEFALCQTAPGEMASQICVAAYDADQDNDVDFEDFKEFQLVFTGGITATVTELAGNSLAGYPHFEYVRAFSADAPVELALDPTRFPAIVGQTCDVYVVAAKDEAQWMVDPALEDVRAGGPQEVTFGGTTIQDNTITLATAYELDADAGIDIGVPYDVVIDVDQDGQLSHGDFLDGSGDQAGCYVVHDLVAEGPLAVTYVDYDPGSWRAQRTWYPVAIDDMEPLPLVVISHGNGHHYSWYGYLQRHLSSYGYVVMSHENQTQPGIETASTTTLSNTDYFLGHLDTIAGGIFEGRVDGSRITWIGHSRGGEGVCRAFDRLYDGDYVPDEYTVEDIALVSSIAPNDYLGRTRSNPHDVPFHLLTGAADGDNAGWPDRESDAPFHVYERAEGYRQVTYVHGADHNDFNCCGWNDFEGPPGTAIGRSEAQRVAKATYLALIKHYVDGNLPAKDYLWRQNEVLKPIGVDPDTIIDREYVEDPDNGVFVIDDFQSSFSLNVSSSGGSVTHTVLNIWEGQLDDTDNTFTWYASDPMNGMVRGRPDDLTRGLVFDWSGGAARRLEFEVVPAAQDMTQYAYLNFRACQGARHPETVAELGDLTFTVTLRDSGGSMSSINIGAYGAGIEEPYQRTGSGSGAGWQNEFESIRIRLTDFLHNGSGLDLREIEAVLFEFGGLSFGSNRGRLGIDDIYLSEDREPGT